MWTHRLAAGVLAPLCIGLAAQAQEVSITAGRALATDRCARCHAVGRTGDSPNPRSPRFRDLGARFPFDGLREALMQGMIVGHPEMPIQHLTQAESGDLIAYMRALQERPPARPRARKIPLEHDE
jgi:mono/diheme cytochrome c family protein